MIKVGDKVKFKDEYIKSLGFNPIKFPSPKYVVSNVMDNRVYFIRDGWGFIKDLEVVMPDRPLTEFEKLDLIQYNILNDV